MADHARAARLSKRILQIAASHAERFVKDPRMELITFTDARLTGDLREATLFYMVRPATPGGEADLDQAAEALNRARGALRKAVGDQLQIRHTPSLAFVLDEVPETAARMEELLERARQKDAAVAAQAATATPAGDADPYKHDDEEVEE